MLKEKRNEVIKNIPRAFASVTPKQWATFFKRPFGKYN